VLVEFALNDAFCGFTSELFGRNIQEMIAGIRKNTQAEIVLVTAVWLDDPKSYDFVVDISWKIVGINDFNADGKPDLIWQNQANGQLYYWLMDGVTRSGGGGYLNNGQAVDTNWKIVGK
jgi:hypothetical protein